MKKNNIQKNIIKDLIIYTIVTIILFWTFQILLLDNFYKARQKKEIIKIGQEIEQNINLDIDRLTSLIEKLSSRANYTIILLDKDRKPIINSDMRGGKNFFRDMIPPEKDMKSPYFPVINGDEIERIDVRPGYKDEETLILSKKIKNKDNEDFYLLINGQLLPLQSTKDTLKEQFIIISIFLVCLSYILAKALSKKLASPINKIAQEAKKLAEGNYETSFEGNDIQEIEELAEALNYSSKGLSNVEKLRKELVANVSHDLKTPLTMIKAYAEMIRDITGDDKDKKEEQLNIIIDETNRLTNLVNDLIKVSKDENYNEEINITNVQIKEEIKKTIEIFKDTIADYKIYINGDEKEVKADVNLLKKILYNLISNAINYTGESKKIDINIIELEDDKTKVEIKDYGRGIPVDQINKIWERYYRSNNTHSRPVVGSGLGLSIVKGAFEKQKIKYGVESEVNIGSCFWFILENK